MLVTEQAADQLTQDDRLAIGRLLRWQRQSIARRLVPTERVAKCYRVMVKKTVNVLVSKKFKRAHYKGLMTCGSVWNCPICAAKVTERRRTELQNVIDRAKEQGFYFVFITFTLQHTPKDKLAEVSDCLTVALGKLKSGRWFMDFKQKWGIAGDVTNIEVTHGANGWHFHKHGLFFTQQNITLADCDQIQAELTKQYQHQLIAMKRYAHPIHGVNVRVGDSFAADYVAKFGHEHSPAWSLAEEVSRSFTKSGKQFESFTPFQLLDLFRAGDTLAGKLFQEYAATMKGFRQLRYSKLLRLNLGITDPEKSDEELADEPDDDAYLLAELTSEEWSKVLRHNRPGQVLEVASTGNAEYLKIYLQSLS